jgi:hypothetical protein
MWHRRQRVKVLLALGWALVVCMGTSQAAGGPGIASEKLVSLAIEFGGGTNSLRLRSKDARQQILVTAKTSSGALRDYTREAEYSVTPPGIVAIDSSGLIKPMADGEATIRADAAEGLSASLPVKVEDYATARPVNFPDQIVPIFTKAGCNAGGCHGKSSGQNGFRLSLLGFEPQEDYEHLVNEARGRRLFPAAPERSLLLLKATATVPHGGGKRLDLESDDYHLLRRWIAQGMPYGTASPLTRLRPAFRCIRASARCPSVTSSNWS